MSVEHVSVRTNPVTRKSRLFHSIPVFVQNSGITMVRMYAMYQPLRVFFYIGTILSIIGLIPVVRFIIIYFTEGGAGHIQSLIIGVLLMLMGFIVYMVGMLADLISFNRQLVEMILVRVRKIELDINKKKE
jgi:hypothetical protein